jgi:hypothetical protein
VSKLTEAFLECERQLEELRYEPGEVARMRRVAINNAMADVLYASAEKLKSEGDDENANFAHREANKHWSAVVEDVADSKLIKSDRKE